MAYVKVKLDIRKLEQLQKDVLPRAEAVIDKVAFDVEASAKHNCERMAFDTGALTTSHYTVTMRSNGQRAAAAEALSRNPGVELVELPVPTKWLLANVGPSVHYAPHVHYGTVKMRYSRPFLQMAVDEHRPYWAAAWKQLLKGY